MPANTARDFLDAIGKKNKDTIACEFMGLIQKLDSIEKEIKENNRSALEFRRAHSKIVINEIFEKLNYGQPKVVP